MKDEDQSSKQKVGELGKLLLGILFVGAAVVTLATFPGLIQLLPRPKRRRRLAPWEVRKAMKRLQDQQLIRVLKQGRTSSRYVLTERGREVAEREARLKQIEELRFPGYQPWDGWWRVVAFDIPERKRHARDALQRTLRELGCYSLQKSVLVTPSPCEKEVKLLCEVFEVDLYVMVFKTDSLPQEEKAIRRYFKL